MARKKKASSDETTVPGRPSGSPIRRSRSPRNTQTTSYRIRSPGPRGPRSRIKSPESKDRKKPTRSTSPGPTTPGPPTKEQTPPLSPKSVKLRFAPDTRLGILINEIPGGALLGNLFDSGSQGFVCSCLPLHRDPRDPNPWLIRKVAEVDSVKVKYRASQPIESFFNDRLRGWAGKVEMTNHVEITPKGTQVDQQIWTMYFPFINGGSLSDFLMNLKRYSDEQPLYLPPLFLWALIRAVCHWLGYLKYGWQPNQDIIQVQPWHSVSHGDLHAGNVLLDWTNANINGGIPKFLLADFGYTRFSAEDRHQLPMEAPFDDLYELKWFHQMLTEILRENIDKNMPGYDELNDLLEKRWPNPPDHRLPRSFRTYPENGPDFATANLSTVSSVDPEDSRPIDPDTTPAQTFEQLSMYCPLTHFMLVYILPATEAIIQLLLDNSLNHIKVFPSLANPADNTWQILRQAMPSEQQVFLLEPGEVAPEWIYSVEGYWKWVAIDANGRISGDVKEECAPRDSMDINTWRYTEQKYGK